MLQLQHFTVLLIDFAHNSSIILDRNKITYDDIKSAMKLINTCKDEISEEEISDKFSGDNASYSLNISNIKSKLDSNRNHLKLSSDQKNCTEYLEKYLSTGKQVLHLIYSSARVEKSF